MGRVARFSAALAVAVLATGGAYAADPVRIGFSLPQTGLFAPAAPSQLNAYELWKDEVNAKGGLDVAGTKRPIQFVIYDDQSDPAQSVKVYEKLITQDKVDLLLAPWGTLQHISIAGVVERNKFPLVGNTAASIKVRDLKPGYMWFTTSALPDVMGQQMALLLKSRGVKTVAITTLQDPFALETRSFLLEGLKTAGIQVVLDNQYPHDIHDMTAMITAAKQANPDAELSLSGPADSVLYLKQSRELGLKPRVQFILVGPTEAFFAKMFGDQVDGLLTLGHWSPAQKKWPQAKPFYDAYEAKYHEPPDYLDTVLSYMSCQILEQAVAKAGLDKEKLREAIASGTFDTIDGPVKFNGVVNATTPTMFLQFQGGTLQIVWPRSEATAEMIDRK